MDKIFFNLLICTFLIASCSVSKHLKEECILDKENNTIKGNSPNAKEFYKKKYFLPRSIEEFLVKGKEPSVEYTDFYNKTTVEQQFAGYHIYGCQDTTWAKQRMAEHLIEKYNIYRYDSTYCDTVYRVIVVDESKLVLSRDSCDRFMSFFSLVDDVMVNEFKCLPWGSVCSSLMPRGMNDDTNSVKGFNREGLYDIIVPANMYIEEGLGEYQKYLLDKLGLEMTLGRIDTVNIGVYEYRE